MTIPNKLIETTINEFAAEGYECLQSNTSKNNYGTDRAEQLIHLIFRKPEEVKNES